MLLCFTTNTLDIVVKNKVSTVTWTLLVPQLYSIDQCLFVLPLSWFYYHGIGVQLEVRYVTSCFYYDAIIWLKIRCSDSFCSIHFCSGLLYVSFVFHAPINFRIDFSVCEELSWNFSCCCTESIDCSGRLTISTRIILPKPGWSLHLVFLISVPYIFHCKHFLCLG